MSARAFRGTLLAAYLVATGSLLLVSLPVLYYAIHGDPQRYEWLISGPPPFDKLGSGPFQLWLGGALGGAGVALLLAGGLVHRRVVSRGGLASRPGGPGE